MITKLLRRFTTATKPTREADLVRKKGLAEIYKPFHDLQSEEEKSSLSYSGQLWLNYAELESRPKMIASAVSQKLNQISELKSRLNIGLSVITRPFLWDLYVKELTHQSTAIEGNSLNQEETNTVLDHFRVEISNGSEICPILSADNKGLVMLNEEEFPLHDIMEVVNNAKAMEYMRANLFTRPNLTEEDIIELNNLINPPNKRALKVEVKDLGPTKYRKLPISIRGSSTVHPYPQEVSAAMKELLKIHNEKIRFLHPIIAATQLHSNFLFIHPFQDGNGRTSRLLLQTVLFHAGYLGPLILNSERSMYFRYLEEQIQHNNTGLFLFMINKVEESMLKLKKSIDNLDKQRKMDSYK